MSNRKCGLVMLVRTHRSAFLINPPGRFSLLLGSFGCLAKGRAHQRVHQYLITFQSGVQRLHLYRPTRINNPVGQEEPCSPTPQHPRRVLTLQLADTVAPPPRCASTIASRRQTVAGPRKTSALVTEWWVVLFVTSLINRRRAPN